MSKRDQRFGSVASVLLVGLVVISIAVNLPYIGGVISFLLTLIGFGMLLIELYRVRRTPAAPVNAL